MQQNDLTREAVQATIAGDGRRALEALDRGGGRVAELTDVGDRRAVMARDYAALTMRERERTLVMDTMREGRELLTQAIRDELRKDGTIRGETVTMATLEGTRMITSYLSSASGRKHQGFALAIESTAHQNLNAPPDAIGSEEGTSPSG